METVNRVLTSLFDLWIQPWAAGSPWPALIVSSLAAAGVLILVFRWTSNAARIRRARNRFVARVLELLLFRHDLRVSLSACGRILVANGGYLRQFVLPMLAGAIPFVLLLAQMAAWFDRRPLATGEATTLTVKLRDAQPGAQTNVELTVPQGFQSETKGVRVPARQEVSWRIRAEQEASGWLIVQAGGQSESKSLSAGSGLARVSTSRVDGGWWNQLLHPSEPPLATAGPIARIDIRYPQRVLSLWNTEVHWMPAALVLMMAFGFVIGRITGVTVA